MEAEKQKIQLEWELASSPKEQFWAKLLPVIAISFFLVSMALFFCYIVFVISSGNQEFKNTLMPYVQVITDYFWLELIILFVFVTATASFFIKVFKTRIVLGDLGVTIEANTVSKTYLWNEFECFSDRADHLSSWSSGSLIPWAVKTLRAKMGKILFYVQFKNPTKMSPYIILETPVRLGEKVRSFVRERLAEV